MEDDDDAAADNDDNDDGRGQLQDLYIQNCNVGSQVRPSILQRLGTKFGHDFVMCIQARKDGQAMDSSGARDKPQVCVVSIVLTNIQANSSCRKISVVRIGGFVSVETWHGLEGQCSGQAH